jgi:sensor c-di-GMP phosphodiesterase-like protein
LIYPRTFPVDILKIDQSLVYRVSTAWGDQSICDRVIAMARSGNLRVVAEGTETSSGESLGTSHELEKRIYCIFAEECVFG